MGAYAPLWKANERAAVQVSPARLCRRWAEQPWQDSGGRKCLGLFSAVVVVQRSSIMSSSATTARRASIEGCDHRRHPATAAAGSCDGKQHGGHVARLAHCQTFVNEQASSFHSFEFPRSRPSPPVPVLLVLLAPTTLLPPPLEHSGVHTSRPGGHQERWDVAQGARIASRHCRSCDIQHMKSSVSHECVCSCRCFGGRTGCGYIDLVHIGTCSTNGDVAWTCSFARLSYADLRPRDSL